MKWLEIGIVNVDYIKKEMLVNLHDGYNKALSKLDMFSHCMLFFLMEDKLELKVSKILKIEENLGQLRLKITEDLYAEGQLVDIKPYFPAEEVILDAREPINRYFINYSNNIIGEYKLLENKTFIQLNKDVLNKLKKNIDLYEIPKKGDYIRVLWWFDRFDKASFRKNRTCNPPYNNAPRTGVFASRSPVRPNPVGSTVVLVENVNLENGIIEILGFDGFVDTKIFQIMFYQPFTDRVDEAQLPNWVSHWTNYKKFDKPKSIKTLIKYEDIPKDINFEDNNICNELETDYNAEDLCDNNDINIYNAHIHNLKNLSISIPKNSINLITGVSGSGKSSLAFDTIYAESKKQFMDIILSNQIQNDKFSENCVDKITGLQPSIVIDQKSLGSNPRSTIGTITKIADILKLIFSAIGERRCPKCHNIVDYSNVCNSCGEILFDMTPQLFSYNNPDYMCPNCKGLGLEMRIDIERIVEHPEKSLLDGASSLYGDLRKHRQKPNANWMRGEILALADDLNEDLELPFKELTKEFRNQFFYGSNGREVSLVYENTKGRSGVIKRPVEGAFNIIKRLTEKSDSTRMIVQAEKHMSKQICSVCNGERLKEEGRLVSLIGYRYVEVVNFSITQLRIWCHKTFMQLNDEQKKKTKIMFVKLNQNLKRIIDVGLSYVSLDRSITSLSGGEVQRLKLATQFGTGLTNILYIMDEPSKGLHPRDYKFLMKAIKDLKNNRNTVILVEHKKGFMEIADFHIEMGPKAGRYGGQIIHVERNLGNFNQLNNHSYNDELENIEFAEKDGNEDEFIELKNVSTNNLKNIDVKIPVGRMTSVIGVSGSGKTSLISKTLYPCIMRFLNREIEYEAKLESIKGIENFIDVSYINQKSIGSNSRSNPGTYTGVFDLIRKFYSNTNEAKIKNFSKEYFSFNSSKGQCSECKGLGEVSINIHYLDNINILCSKCQGKRYSDDILNIKWNGMSIGDILDMEIQDLLEIFKDENEIVERLYMLDKVGLGYLKLGQSASSLSGGEAQRIKLAKELYKKDCKNVIYILDEPTTGLHEDDIKKVISVLDELKEKGATIIVIEHNMNLIKESDYVIELGPNGGAEGGYIIRSGYQNK